MKIAYLLAGCSLFFISCSKDDNNNNCAGLNSTTIAGTYRLTGLKYKQNTSAPEQDYLFMFPCLNNDVFSFNANGSFQVQDVAPACTPTSGQFGSWSLTGSVLTIETDDHTVTSFNCATLVYFDTDVNTAGDRLTYTLTRQ